MFNFDTPVVRDHTFCEKYDSRLDKFGKADVLPLWVADMDFTAPPCVIEALQKRLDHGVFGYSFAPDGLLEALYAWFERHHQWQIKPEQVQLTTGVVPSLFAAVQALTEVGDKIIVPTPVYPPFFSAVTNHQRELVESPLVENNLHYSLDFEHLELAAKDAKMLLLCNPHNPVGRVWQLQELQRLIDIAVRYQLIIVSDDIHCDMAYSGSKYTPLAKLAPKELRLITAISPSKTFNIPGINLSALVCSHSDDQQAIGKVFRRVSANPFNPLNMAAFEAAYQQGDAWLFALKQYLQGNADLVLQELADTDIQLAMPEATVLLWLNCKKLGLSDAELSQFFIEKAGLGLNDGISFGQGGSGYMRLNIATQRQNLVQAMKQLKTALY